MRVRVCVREGHSAALCVCVCMLVVFGQSHSQCTVSAVQSEQTVLVERRDFVENESFERTYNNVQYLKTHVFFEH